MGTAVGFYACFYLPDPPTLYFVIVSRIGLFSGIFYYPLLHKALNSLAPAEAG